MAKVKEVQMAKDELMDNIQKFVLCGRAMLDAIEQIAVQSAVFKVQSAKEASDEADLVASEKSPAKRVFSDEGASAERPSFPDASGKRVDAQPEATLEEVRGLLAEKSRSGFRAEVKALLTAHGVEKLSEITDPVELGKLKAEAEELDNGR